MIARVEIRKVVEAVLMSEIGSNLVSDVIALILGVEEAFVK